MEPLVYLIVVNYNGITETRELIENIKQITYSNYKMVVVDNCSSQQEIQELKKEEGIQLICSKYNGGFSAGNNLGIQFAIEHGAKYIALINNDTIVEKNFLSIAVEDLQRMKDKNVVTGKILYYSHPEKIWYAGGEIRRYRGRAYHFQSNELDTKKNDRERFVTYATGCFLVLPVQIIQEIGLMEEKYFLYFEDTEYSYRILKAGSNILYDPKIRIYHKIGASTNNGSDLYDYYNWRNRLYFIKDNLKGLSKRTAQLFYIYEGIKRVIKKDLNYRILVQAFKDYEKNITGNSFIKRVGK